MDCTKNSADFHKANAVCIGHARKRRPTRCGVQLYQHRTPRSCGPSLTLDAHPDGSQFAGVVPALRRALCEERTQLDSAGTLAACPATADFVFDSEGAPVDGATE